MKIRRFFGKDMREALKQVKDELGGDAVIMSNKKVANGVELVAAIDPVSAPMATNEAAVAANNRPVVANRDNQFEARVKPAVQEQPSNNLREIIGDSGTDTLQALLQKRESSQAGPRPVKQQAQQPTIKTTQTNQAGAQSNLHRNPPLHYSQQPEYGNTPEPRSDERIFRSPAFIEPTLEHSLNAPHSTQASGMAGINSAAAPTPPPSVLEPGQLDIIKAELESIKNVLKFQVSELADERNKRHNPVHHYLHQQLTKMGVSQDLAKQFIAFLPYQIDEKQGWKYILNLLSNRLHVGGNDILNQSGVVALVGPTGTGKTTTVAKLAAKYAQKHGPEQVALVTIDTYRIAAFEQLATYGKIIGCAVKKAHSSQELNDILYQMRNKKLVLIDTAGFSQRDARLIDQLTEYEHNLNINIRKYLVLPAGSQYQVLNQTVKAYKNTDISGSIFTKLDECYSMGEALSVIIENDLSLSYVTDGQRVPEDIKLADSANLTLIAAKLFKRYGNGEVSTEVGANTGAI
jgi:flagellar biosynthesis protein FlhF